MLSLITVCSADVLTSQQELEKSVCSLGGIEETQDTETSLCWVCWVCLICRVILTSVWFTAHIGKLTAYSIAWMLTSILLICLMKSLQQQTMEIKYNYRKFSLLKYFTLTFRLLGIAKHLANLFGQNRQENLRKIFFH